MENYNLNRHFATYGATFN